MPLEPTSSGRINTGVVPADRSESAVADSASRVQEKVSELGHSTADKLHRTRVAAADALNGTADSLHNKADRISELGHDGAARVGVAARYIREHGTRDMLADVTELTRAHPGKALLAALAVGFLTARALRRG